MDFFIGSDHLQQRASSHSHGNLMCGCGGVACLCRNIGGCIWCLGRAVVAGGYLIPPEEQYASYAAALERVGCAVRLYADGGTARATCRQAPKPSSHRRTSSRERPACHRPRRSCCWDIAEEQRRAPSPQRLAAAAAAAAASGSSGSRGAWPHRAHRPGGRDRARPVVSARHKSRLERASRGRKPRVGPRRVSCGESLVCIKKVSHKHSHARSRLLLLTTDVAFRCPVPSSII